MRQSQQEIPLQPLSTPPAQNTSLEQSAQLIVTASLAQYYCVQGDNYQLEGEYSKAISMYTTSSLTQQENPHAYWGLGNTYLLLGQYQKALCNYNMSISQQPVNPEAYIQRGNVYMQIKSYNLALTDYSISINQQPMNPVAYYGRGKAYLFTNQPDKAINDLSISIEQQPMNPHAYRRRGDAYLKMNRYDLALNDYNTTIKQQPQDLEAHRGLTQIYNAELEGIKRLKAILHASANNPEEKQPDDEVVIIDKPVNLSPNATLPHMNTNAGKKQSNPRKRRCDDHDDEVIIIDKPVNFSPNAAFSHMNTNAGKKQSNPRKRQHVEEIPMRGSYANLPSNVTLSPVGLVMNASTRTLPFSEHSFPFSSSFLWPQESNKARVSGVMPTLAKSIYVEKAESEPGLNFLI